MQDDKEGTKRAGGGIQREKELETEFAAALIWNFLQSCRIDKTKQKS